MTGRAAWPPPQSSVDGTKVIPQTIVTASPGSVKPMSSTTQSTTGIAIKCPQIKFGDTYDHLVVVFNTMDDLDTTMNISREYHTTAGKSSSTDPFMRVRRGVIHDIEDEVS